MTAERVCAPWQTGCTQSRSTLLRDMDSWGCECPLPRHTTPPPLVAESTNPCVCAPCLCVPVCPCVPVCVSVCVPVSLRLWLWMMMWREETATRIPAPAMSWHCGVMCRCVFALHCMGPAVDAMGPLTPWCALRWEAKLLPRNLRKIPPAAPGCGYVETRSCRGSCGSGSGSGSGHL